MALYCCFAAVINWVPWTTGVEASDIIATDDFRDVAAAVMRYADEFGPEHVLLVLDIDNTLLAMNGELGSDQWFEWQTYLLDHEPDSDDLVADSFDELLRRTGHAIQPGPHASATARSAAIILSRLQGRGIHTLVLTSRGPEYRVATERELRRNGYEFATAMPVEPAEAVPICHTI